MVVGWLGFVTGRGPLFSFSFFFVCVYGKWQGRSYDTITVVGWKENLVCLMNDESVEGSVLGVEAVFVYMRFLKSNSQALPHV